MTTVSKLNFKAPPLKSPAPPKHLGRPEQRLWREIVDTYRFDDAAALTMLRTALESHHRARQCRERIDKDGPAILDRWGQLKPHPLLAAERDARAALLSALKALNLDLGVAS
jgi:P27 family predicted phage terminase small subunit